MKKLVKGKIDGDRKCLAKLDIKAQHHTLPAETDCSILRERRARMKNVLKKNHKTPLGKDKCGNHGEA